MAYSVVKIRTSVSGGEGLAARVNQIILRFVAEYIRLLNQWVVKELRSVTPKRTGRVARGWRVKQTGAYRGQITNQQFYSPLVRFRHGPDTVSRLFFDVHRKYGDRLAKAAWRKAIQ